MLGRGAQRLRHGSHGKRRTVACGSQESGYPRAVQASHHHDLFGVGGNASGKSGVLSGVLDFRRTTACKHPRPIRAPHARGEGIGRLLLAEVERKAHSPRCCKITGSAENNPPARKLYASVVFAQAVYQAEAEDALFLAKPLKPQTLSARACFGAFALRRRVQSYFSS
jgi:GNAT superfamily N-acetyltransferase